MAQQPFLDPYAAFQIDPNQGVNPETLQAYKRGQSAQGELDQLQEGSAMANALRMSQAEFDGGVRGSGLAATSPGIANALAHVFQRYQGGQKLGLMEEQAKALRGEVVAGEDAELAMANQRGTYDEQQRLARRQAEINLQRSLADEAAQRKEVISETKGKQPRSGNKVYIGPDGETVLAYQSKDGDVLRADSKEPLQLDKYKDIKQVENEMGFGNGTAGLNNTERTAVVKANERLIRLSKIQNTAKELSDADRAALSRPGFRAALGVASPSAFENWIKNNAQGLSPQAKRYLEEVALYSADERHARFGSALTTNETVLANAFLPSANDVGFADMMGRMNVFGEDALSSMKAYSQNSYYPEQLMSRAAWKPWQTEKVQLGDLDAPSDTGGQAITFDKVLPIEQIKKMSKEQRAAYKKYLMEQSDG